MSYKAVSVSVSLGYILEHGGPGEIFRCYDPWWGECHCILHKHTIVFRVAGVDDAGTGPFDAILTNTDGMLHMHNRLLDLELLSSSNSFSMA